MCNNLRKSMSQRRGFTLVELLVVIAIIAILAALGSVAAFALVGVRQQRNSEATIRVANKLLQDRVGTVITEAKKESPSPAAMILAGNDPARAKVIWVKFRLMEAFPQNYQEITAPWVYNIDPTIGVPIPAASKQRYNAKYKSALAGVNMGANKAATQSSACLLLALKTVGSDGGVNVQDQLSYAVADTDGDGLPEFADGFGNALTFVRFGQGVSPAAAGTKNLDPVDNGGLLLTGSWYGWALRPTFDTKIHAIGPGNGTAFFTIPVIMSAGKDGVLGNGDDIISFKLTGD